jgi:hypothetical protein
MRLSVPFPPPELSLLVPPHAAAPSATGSNSGIAAIQIRFPTLMSG